MAEPMKKPQPLFAIYNPHHRQNAEGHIYIEKNGCVTIGLMGASAMTQQELNFFGGIFAAALCRMTAEEIETALSFKPKEFR